MEHPSTRLYSRSGDTHAVSPNIPVVIAASPSARRKSLIRFASGLLARDDSPDEGLASRSIILSDANLEQIRSTLQIHR